MEARNVVPVIPMRKSRRLHVVVDRALYRLRNLVERCFSTLKNVRRVANRYDRTAGSPPRFCRHHINPPVDLLFVNIT